MLARYAVNCSEVGRRKDQNKVTKQAANVSRNS